MATDGFRWMQMDAKASDPRREREAAVEVESGWRATID